MSDPVFTIAVSITAMLLVALLMERLRLPFVLGVLLAGMLLGPNSPLAGLELGSIHFSDFLVTDENTVNAFAEIGAILILFQIGVEFSLPNLLKLGLTPIAASLLKMGFVFFMGYEIALLFLGFPTPAAFFLGVILAMSSTPLIVQLLKSKAEAMREEALLVTAMLIVEDVFAVFALGILLSLGSGMDLSYWSVAVSLLKTGVTFLLAYFVLGKLLGVLAPAFVKTEETLLFAALVVSVGVGWATQAAGLSAAIGAFLAGSVLAGLPEGRKLEEKVRPFEVLFSALFFFSIGMMVELQSLGQYWLLTVLFALIALVGKFTSASVAAYLTGVDGKSAVFVGVAMLTLSEVSLLIAREGTKLNVVSIDVLSVASAVLFLSAFANAVLIARVDALYAVLAKAMPEGIALSTKRISQGVSLLKRVVSERPRALEAGAPEFYGLLLKHSVHSVLYLLLAILMMLTAVVTARVESDYTFAVLVLLEAVAIVSLLASLWKVKNIIDEVVGRVAVRHGSGAASFALDLFASAFFFLCGLFAPAAADLLGVPFLRFFMMLAAFPLSFYYAWDASRKMGAVLERTVSKHGLRLKKEQLKK